MIIYSIIPARSGSKGIKNKNLKQIGGKSLLQIAIDSSLNSKYINKTFVSTDSSEYSNLAKKFGAIVPYLRPKEISKDDSPTIDLIKDLINYFKSTRNLEVPNLICLLQPTSPFRKTKDIDNAISKFDWEKSSSLVSITDVPHNMVPECIYSSIENNNLIKYNEHEPTSLNRSKKNKYFCRNGAAIYITKTAELISQDKILASPIQPYYMNKISSLDIDDNDDLLICRAINFYKEHLN